MSGTQRPERDERDLVVLLADVRRTRAAVRLARAAPSDFTSRQNLILVREELIAALQAYSEAAGKAGLPLPRLFRDELRLFVSLRQSERFRSSPVK